MPPKLKPTVLLISLEKEDLLRELFADHLNALSTHAKTVEATTKKEALTLLKQKPLAAICTDAAITKPKNVNFAWQVASYANSGGFVVFAGLFALRTTRDEFDELMKTVFQQSWRMGHCEDDYCTFNSNCANEIVMVDEATKQYVKEVKVKAAFLRHVREIDQLYMPKTYAQGGTPVAMTDLGNGWVGFVGDMQGCEELVAPVLALSGLFAWALNYSA
ncbi:MAG: hypothetical protein Q9227_003420 [Pyrenula ochraceoflavens]